MDDQDDEMRPEYEFRGGVRGKHAAAYRQGHTVKIQHLDGTMTEQPFASKDGAAKTVPPTPPPPPAPEPP